MPNGQFPMQFQLTIFVREAIKYYCLRRVSGVFIAVSLHEEIGQLQLLSWPDAVDQEQQTLETLRKLECETSDSANKCLTWLNLTSHHLAWLRLLFGQLRKHRATKLSRLYGQLQQLYIAVIAVVVVVVYAKDNASMIANNYKPQA